MTYVLDQGLKASGRAHPLDPRTRLILAVGFAVTTVALSSLISLACAWGIALLLLLRSPLPLWPSIRRILAMDGFLVLMVIMLPFTTPGTALFTVWGQPASIEGLYHAAQIMLTANATVMALLALCAPLTPVSMGHAMHRLGVPARLVQLLMFTIRYIELLGEEYKRLRQAMILRGFRASTNWHSYRSLGYLAGMVLVRALDRAERVLIAMKCRGFTGVFPLLQRMEMGGRDIWALIGMAMVLLALIGLDVQFA
jgi:cobalt/nickel transport system permease protein